VVTLRPTRLLKKVLLTVTLLASVTTEENVRLPRLGREMNSMVLTAVNTLIDRVDNRVRSSAWKVPLI